MPFDILLVGDVFVDTSQLVPGLINASLRKPNYMPSLVYALTFVQIALSHVYKVYPFMRP